jgi:membrane protease subunit (stomatin/prohibitin family)
MGGRRILAEAAGNNRYVVVSDDVVLVGSVGVVSGSWFGKKVKSYPIDSITAVDVRQALLTAELEIVMAGAAEAGAFNSWSSRALNENVTAFPRGAFAYVQWMGAFILQIREYRRQQIRPSYAHQQPAAQHEQWQGQSWRGQPQGVAQQAPVPAHGVVEQLQQLAELRDKGLITTEDFEAKKRELLGRM